MVVIEQKPIAKGAAGLTEHSGQRQLDVVPLGRIGYAAALKRQVARRDAILNDGANDALFLLEHDPVFTLGRNAERQDVLVGREWLENNGVEVFESDRGGQVTYHGPGQIVGYPILNLSPHRRDIRRYVQDLQEVIVRTLADYGIAAEGGAGERIGVWTKEPSPRKIASIGIHLKRWVTTHGFALNVATDLDHFQGIVACGLDDVQMVTMDKLLGRQVTLDQVGLDLIEHFAEVFGHLPITDGDERRSESNE